MKTVLLVHPCLQPPGGGSAVAVWMIEALKRDHAVSALTCVPIDLDPINRFYGTSLSLSDFTAHQAHPLMHRLSGLTPGRYNALELGLLRRSCMKMKDDFDVIITADNEVDFGCRGIQYIHFPWYGPLYNTLQNRGGLSRYSRPWGFLRVQIWSLVSGHSFDRLRNNLTLVNSDWTGTKFEGFYGRKPLTVYPPVPGVFPEVDWEEKENGFVCIGRISPEKRLGTIIDILASVRSQGAAVHLHIIGTPGHVRYYKQLRQRVQENGSWIFLNENLSREDLIQLVSKHRYGIHGMVNEHFGIAIAEMIQAGCIVYVPRSGGQMEIVGGDDRLMYGTADEAVAKIVRVITDPKEQASLRDYLKSRKALFTTDQFVRRIRDIVREF